MKLKPSSINRSSRSRTAGASSYRPLRCGFGHAIPSQKVLNGDASAPLAKAMNPAVVSSVPPTKLGKYTPSLRIPVSPGRIRILLAASEL